MRERRAARQSAGWRGVVCAVVGGGVGQRPESTKPMLEIMHTSRRAAPLRVAPGTEKSQHGCRVTCTFRLFFFARRRFPGRLIDGSYQSARVSHRYRVIFRSALALFSLPRRPRRSCVTREIIRGESPRRDVRRIDSPVRSVDRPVDRFSNRLKRGLFDRRNAHDCLSRNARYSNSRQT